MKVYLVFPPPWTPAMPYLALPALTGFLRAHNIAVIQRDLNVETYDAILSRAHLEQTLKKLRAEFSGRRTLPAPIEWAFAHGSQLAAKINAAKEIFRSQAFYDGEKSLDAFTTIAQSLELASLPFQPAQLDFLHFIPASPVDSSCDLLAGVRDAKHNLFLDMFKRGIVADIAREKPDIVGISIPTEGQMVAAFTLAHLIKQAGLKCHVTIGGPHVSMLREQIPHAPLLFDVIDSAVIFDGEMALLKLSEAIEGKCTMSDVPNLIHRADGTIHTNATAMHPDALTQVTPDFDGLPLKTYFVPDLVLPLITAHGCYHGLCAFCNVGYGAGKGFAPMDVERLLAQILSVHKKYNCRHIFFTDEAMPPRTMRLLAERLANLGPPIVWTSCARFEKAISAELLRDAARGGCVMLLFGLETASERMIQLMVKGTQRETMSRLLQEGTQAGIWNHTFFFFGFPTETLDDAQDTVNFIYANQNAIHSASPGTFVLERYAPVHLDPTRYGVTRIIENPERDLAIYFDYKQTAGLDETMAQTVVDRLFDVLPGKRFGQYYAHDVYRFLYATHLRAQGKSFPAWLMPER